MIGYEISVRCICGNENTYILNALRYPVVTLGRLQEGNIGCADIGVCADDKRRMSRKMLNFFYDRKLQDWVVGAGEAPSSIYQLYGMDLPSEACLPEDPLRERKGKQLFYLPEKDFFAQMDTQIPALIKGEKLMCERILKHSFRCLETRHIALRDIVGIGLMDKRQLSYQGAASAGVHHPLLGMLPFGWYVEVKTARPNQQAVQSFVNKSSVFQEK